MKVTIVAFCLLTSGLAKSLALPRIPSSLVPHESRAIPVNRNRTNNPKFKILTQSLLEGSDLMYTFAKLRRRTIDNEILPDTDPKKVALLRPELILTKKHSALEEQNSKFYRNLEHEVTGADIQLFIDLNKEFVQGLPQVLTKEGAFDNIDTIVQNMQTSGFSFYEFDDQFADKELVYGITINRTDKRITVFFRGTVTGNRDWSTNFNALFKTLEPPNELGGVCNDKINVHRGFYSYLNERLDEKTDRALSPWQKLFIKPDDDVVTKFGNIEANLRSLLEKHKGFKVYCSGHSLGGALSQLLAYQLAGYGSLRNFKNACPVTAITFASPNVGDGGFNKAYQRLEEKRLVRHIRVSNAGDIVPVSIAGFGYTQTGVHLYVMKGSMMEIGYRRLSTVLSQLAYAWKHRSGGFKLLGDIAGHHALNEYNNNLMDPTNDKLLMSSGVEELYDDYAGNYTN
jgi:hypothetical protein